MKYSFTTFLQLVAGMAIIVAMAANSYQSSQLRRAAHYKRRLIRMRHVARVMSAMPANGRADAEFFVRFCAHVPGLIKAEEFSKRDMAGNEWTIILLYRNQPARKEYLRFATNEGLVALFLNGAMTDYAYFASTSTAAPLTCVVKKENSKSLGVQIELRDSIATVSLPCIVWQRQETRYFLPHARLVVQGDRDWRIQKAQLPFRSLRAIVSCTRENLAEVTAGSGDGLTLGSQLFICKSSNGPHITLRVINLQTDRAACTIESPGARTPVVTINDEITNWISHPVIAPTR